MSLILTVSPGMESYAAGETGESAAASGLQDENSQRLEAVTAMDENGDIYEVGETDGTVDETMPKALTAKIHRMLTAKMPMKRTRHCRKTELLCSPRVRRVQSA